MGNAASPNLVLIKPPDHVRDFVETFWTLDFDGAPSPAPERILPSVSAEIIVNRTSGAVRIRGADGEAVEYRGALVVAPRDRPFAIYHEPHERIVGAHLKPGALFALTGVPASHLKNRFIGLADVVDVRGAPDDLYPPFAIRHAVDTLVALFRNRLSHMDTIAQCLTAADSAGRSIGDLMESLHFSYYKLHRSSSDRLGFTPKQFLRVRRFERSVRALSRSSRSLVEIALESGYYDQAHFHNDFMDFSGVTPTQYRLTASYDPYHLPGPFQKISNTP